VRLATVVGLADVLRPLETSALRHLLEHADPFKLRECLLSTLPGITPAQRAFLTVALDSLRDGSVPTASPAQPTFDGEASRPQVADGVTAERGSPRSTSSTLVLSGASTAHFSLTSSWERIRVSFELAESRPDRRLPGHPI